MGKIISLEQSHAIIARLQTTAPWDEADPAKVQEFITGPNKDMAGGLFIEWLNRGCVPLLVDNMIVDLDADPFCPVALTVESNEKGGLWRFDPKAIDLNYLDDGQKYGSPMVGHDLCKALIGQPTMNANMLDWYLIHPDRIPQECTGKAICFWGTKYRNDADALCVRSLRWLGGAWYSDHRCIDYGFDSLYTAAVCIKPAA